MHDLTAIETQEHFINFFFLFIESPQGAQDQLAASNNMLILEFVPFFFILLGTFLNARHTQLSARCFPRYFRSLRLCLCCPMLPVRWQSLAFFGGFPVSLPRQPVFTSLSWQVSSRWIANEGLASTSVLNAMWDRSVVWALVVRCITYKYNYIFFFFLV